MPCLKINKETESCKIEEEVEIKMQKWIPVTERLPGNESVLIYSEGWGVAEGKYHPDTGEWTQYRWNAVRKPITHWMPLPEPPKETTE